MHAVVCTCWTFGARVVSTYYWQEKAWMNPPPPGAAGDEAESDVRTIIVPDWREINPDIFGSMIQGVADDEERGALGMHYISVPNILKVLNPLFLDTLQSELMRQVLTRAHC
jgi:hypothetical protein